MTTPNNSRAISNFNAHRREADSETGRNWAAEKIRAIYAATRPVPVKAAKPRTRKTT